MTLCDDRQIGIPGYVTRPSIHAGTPSGNTNLPGHLDFSYQIAFSTTPIDASVFLPAAPTLPEPATWALMLIGLAGALARKKAPAAGASNPRPRHAPVPAAGSR